MNYLKASLQGASLRKQLLWLIFVIFFCALFFFLFGIAIGYLFYGSAILDTANYSDLSNNKSIGILKYTQTITHIGIFLLPSLLFSYLLFERPVSFYRLKNKLKLKSIGIAILLPIISLPLTYWLFDLNSQLDLPAVFDGFEKWIFLKEEEAETFLKAFFADKSNSALLVNLFMIAIIPAIGEELLFRGIIQNLFAKATKRIHIAVWITAFLFSAMHMQFLGFLPRMFLGLLLGYLYAISKNLWLPIIMHFVNNALGVLAAHFYGTEVLESESDMFGYDNSFLLIISSFLCCFFLIYTFNYKNKKPLNKHA